MVQHDLEVLYYDILQMVSANNRIMTTFMCVLFSLSGNERSWVQGYPIAHWKLQSIGYNAGHTVFEEFVSFRSDGFRDTQLLSGLNDWLVTSRLWVGMQAIPVFEGFVSFGSRQVMGLGIPNSAVV